MSLLQHNAMVAVARDIYDALSKRTSSVPVIGLEEVPAYIEDRAGKFAWKGELGPTFRIRMRWDPAYQLHDGDKISGYNPEGSDKPTIYTLMHVSYQEGGGDFDNAFPGDQDDLRYRQGYLVGQRQSGASA